MALGDRERRGGGRAEETRAHRSGQLDGDEQAGELRGGALQVREDPEDRHQEVPV